MKYAHYKSVFLTKAVLGMITKIYSQTCEKRPYQTRHILAFQTSDCLLLHESSGSFLHYFPSAISNHLSIAISMSPAWMVAYNRLNCK